MLSTRSDIQKQFWYVLAILFLSLTLVMTVFIAHKVDKDRNILDQLQSDSIPVGMLDIGTKGDILKRLGVFEPQQNDFSRYKPNTTVTHSARFNLFQQKRQVGSYTYKAKNHLQVERHASSYFPELNIKIEQSLLFDPNNGILTNPGENNKQTEKQAILSIYNRQGLAELNSIGLRLYGSKENRINIGTSLNQNYQLFFKEKYGLSELYAQSIFSSTSSDNQASVNSLVVLRENILQKSVALKLSEALGLPAIRHELVNFKINGNDLGLKLAYEHLDARQWQMNNSESIYFFRNGDDINSSSGYWRRELSAWYRAYENKLTMGDVEKYIDLKQFTRNIILHMFCGSSDWGKWAFYRSSETNTSKWQWIESDLSTCIVDRWNTRKQGEPLSKQNWIQVAALKDSESKRWISTYNYDDFRSSIFSDLLNNDPSYQDYFLTLLQSMLTNELSAEKLNDLISFYKNIPHLELNNKTENNRLTIPEIEEFLLKRAEFIQTDLKNHF